MENETIDGAASERARVSEIIDIGTKLNIRQAFLTKHIESGSTVESFRAALINDMAARSTDAGTAQVMVSQDEGDTLRQGIEGALYSRLSGTDIEGPAKRYRGASLSDLARAWLQGHGERVNPFDRPYDLLARATSGVGQHTTSDFATYALGAAMGRYLRERIALSETGASSIVTARTVSDFRQVTEVQTSSFPALSKVNEAGEITYGTLSDSGEVLRIGSYAKGIKIAFAAMANDDLSGLQKAIQDISFAVNDLKASLIMAALSANLADGNPLFHSTHGNLAAAGTVIDVANLSAGRKAIRDQVRFGTTAPMGLSPAIILVGSAKETEAQQLLANITPATPSNVNPFSGQLRIAVEPKVTGNNWYLFVSPGTYPCVRWATLEGFDSPRVERSEMFDSLGSAWRVHWHVGAAPVDYRGAYKNPGA